MYVHVYKFTVLWENIAKHEIRTEKCSDMCHHHKMKFVLIFNKNDLTLVEINVIKILAWTLVRSKLKSYRSKWELYRPTPKVFGKCQMSDCYFMLCIVQ